MILETVIVHGSDFIEWLDASGNAGGTVRRIAPARLRIELTKAPRNLRIAHKPRATALLRTTDTPLPPAKEPVRLALVVPGEATPAQRVPPAQNPYLIEGIVRDPAGEFLPRRFSLNGGTAAGHQIRLFRSPLGSRYGSAGGVFGRLTFADDAPAAWALVELSVKPPLGATQTYTAQADAHGEFILPLDRLPAVAVDAVVKSYPATLTVLASATTDPNTPFDPDELVACDVATGKDAGGQPEFAPSLSFTFTPGAISRVVSPEHSLLRLKSN